MKKAIIDRLDPFCDFAGTVRSQGRYSLAVVAALAVATSAAADDEDCSVLPRAELVEALQRADLAWQALDGAALDGAMGDVRRHVPCLAEPIELPLVLQLHQAFARHAWTTYDPQTSARAWLAVRDLAPTWTDAYDDDVAADHPVRELWAQRPQWTTTLDEEPPGGWLVDGTASATVPLDRAFVLQALDRRGRVVYSAWHVSAADVPQSPWRAQRIRRIRTRGTVLAGGLALTGAGLLGAGLLVREQMKSVPARDLPAYQTRANTLAGTGGGMLGASALAVGVLWAVKW